MEAFTCGGHVPNDVAVAFPDNLTPFPEAPELLYGDRMLQIRAPDIDNSSTPPPQKLRPIRCNGRNPTEYVDPNGGRDATPLSCDGVVSSHELGFVTQLSTQDPSLLDGGTSTIECSGVVLPQNGEGGSIYVGCSVLGRQIKSEIYGQQIKSEINAECMNIVSQPRILEAELSSSFDDDEEELSEAFKVHLHRKRKRTRKRLELFLENMMKKVIQKQEQMHKQLLEMIEKKEQERLMREEVWRQQELERDRRGEEVRAQETCRNLALISYIQNILGNEFQIPKTIKTTMCMEKEEGESHSQEVFKCHPSNRRWPKSEVQALIKLRSAFDQKFLKCPKGSVWEEVANGLSNMGYSRTPKKCKEKWENINKYYKKTLENGKKRSDNGTSCTYFHELDTLYKSGLITTGNASGYIKMEDEGVIAKE